MSSKIWAACLAALLALSGGAVAETDGRLYFSGGGGLMRLSAYCDSSPMVGQQKCEDTEEAVQAALGYSLSENFAIEAGWMRSEGFNASGRYVDGLGGLGEKEWNISMRNQAAHVAFRASARLTEYLGITGMAGAYHWVRNFDLGGDVSSADQRIREQLFTASSEDERGTDFVGGAGVEMFFTPKLSSQWRWSRYVGERYQGDLYSANFVYQF